MPANKTVAIVAGAVVAAGSLIAIAQLGPLNPPSGPVADTGPSLAELESGTGLPGGLLEFEVFNAPADGALETFLQSQLIAEGRVFVKSISGIFVRAAVFDGAGEIDLAGRPVAPLQVVGRIYNNSVGTASDGLAAFSSTTVELNTVVENGLHLAVSSQESVGFVTVVFMRLD